MENNVENIDTRTLKLFYPLCYLTEDELELLSSQLTVHHAISNHVLINLGAEDNQALYLLQGEVKLTARDERSFTVKSGSEKSLKPISHLNPHLYTVTAVSPVTYIFVNNQVLDNLSSREGSDSEQVENLFIQDETIDNPLFHDIFRDLEGDRLVLPSLPDIILRLRRLINDDCDIKRLTTLVTTEPALTAMLMKVANSAIFHSLKEITTVEDAIKRVGIKTLQNFVMGYAMRNLFKTKSTYLKKQLQKLWTHSTEVAAISYVLCKKTGLLNPEHAMLLGLLHDIGMLPIIKYSENYPEIANNEAYLNDTIRKLHGEIGAIILKKWNFTQDFVEIATGADEWKRDPAPEADYCDIVLVAQLLSFMGKRLEVDTPPVDDRPLPNLTDIPAYRKLGLDDYTPENSIQLIHDAKDEIAEALHLLAM